MTDQPTAAIVSQRAYASAQALKTYLSIRGLKDGEIIRHFARFRAEIEAAAIERCAVAAIGEKVDAPEMQQDTDAEYNSGIDDAVQAIRNLKGQ